MRMKKLLLLLTGGTICSFPDLEGHRSSDAKMAAPLLVETLRNSRSAYKNYEIDVETGGSMEQSAGKVTSDCGKYSSGICGYFDCPWYRYISLYSTTLRLFDDGKSYSGHAGIGSKATDRSR